MFVEKNLPLYLIVEANGGDIVGLSAAFTEEDAVEIVRTTFGQTCRALATIGELPPLHPGELQKVRLAAKVDTENNHYMVKAHLVDRNNGADIDLVAIAAQKGSIEAMMWLTYMGIILKCRCGSLPNVSNWQNGLEHGMTIRCPHCGAESTESDSHGANFEFVTISEWNSHNMT